MASRKCVEKYVQKSEKMGAPRAPRIGQKVINIDPKRGPKEMPISRGVPKGSQGRPGDDFGAILGAFFNDFYCFPMCLLQFLFENRCFPSQHNCSKHTLCTQLAHFYTTKTKLFRKRLVFSIDLSQSLTT